MFRFITIFFFFVAFLLLLLTSLSLPIIKSIKLFEIWLNASSGSFLDSEVEGSVSFGVWGYCISSVVEQLVGVDHTTPGSCSSPRLGYKVDSKITQLLRIDDLANVIDGALTFALVLHPILCGLAFFAMICATAAAFRQHRSLGVCALLLAGFTALLATISFIIDLCLVATTKSRVEHISDNLHVGWGAITWMTLTAAICLWIGSVTLCLTFLRSKRSKKTETY